MTVVSHASERLDNPQIALWFGQFINRRREGQDKAPVGVQDLQVCLLRLERRNRVEYDIHGSLRYLLHNSWDRSVRRNVVVDDVCSACSAAIVFVVGGGCGNDWVEATELR